MTIENQYGFKGVEMQSVPTFFHGLENQYGFKGVEIIIDYKGRASKTVRRIKINEP